MTRKKTTTIESRQSVAASFFRTRRRKAYKNSTSTGQAWYRKENGQNTGDGKKPRYISPKEQSGAWDSFIEKNTTHQSRMEEKSHFGAKRKKQSLSGLKRTSEGIKACRKRLSETGS